MSIHHLVQLSLTLALLASAAPHKNGLPMHRDSRDTTANHATVAGTIQVTSDQCGPSGATGEFPIVPSARSNSHFNLTLFLFPSGNHTHLRAQRRNRLAKLWPHRRAPLSFAWLPIQRNLTRVPGAGWTPPHITVDDMIVKDLSEALKDPNTPFKACAACVPLLHPRAALMVFY
jgi:hypothetical protein